MALSQLQVVLEMIKGHEDKIKEVYAQGYGWYKIQNRSREEDKLTG